MSSLYNKYRPLGLDEVVGNSDTIGYLEGMLQKPQKDRPHVFLFYGPTGCGKTTLARIISKEFGCDPVDLREINTADFRGIDSVRGMIRNSQYHSLGGGVRVWLIDECHKMTTDAQNALLKLLEDSPKRSYFILCTTEPEKLLKTVKGRCIQLQVSPLTDRQMIRLLKTVTKSEGKKKLDRSIYDQIIQDSFGHPRNALQILEKVLSVSSDQQLDMARQSAVQYSNSIELCRALIGNSPWKKVSVILGELKDQEAESIRRHVLGYCQAILLNKDDRKAAHIIEAFQDPFYSIGFPGLVLACYMVIKG